MCYNMPYEMDFACDFVLGGNTMSEKRNGLGAILATAAAVAAATAVAVVYKDEIKKFAEDIKKKFEEAQTGVDDEDFEDDEEPGFEVDIIIESGDGAETGEEAEAQE